MYFNATHYEIRLWDFNFGNQTLQGEAFIDFTVTFPSTTLVLELKSLTVTDVSCDSHSVASFSQEDDRLTIDFGETIDANENITLDVRYGGNTFNETWGGVHWWGNYVYNLGVGFDSQPHNLGKAWFPCVDNFPDKATYSLYLTVTNDKKAICGGNLVNVFDNGDGTSTWHWETPQEISTYHISFAVGDYVLWEDVYHGVERDIPITVYVKPSQINQVPGTFTHVKDIAAFYEACFGPYPFNRIGYVCTGQGCMEHTDNIAVTAGVISGNTNNEEYVAHELSHMYFGNKTTCITAGDMWLNEGFAQFCGLFYRSAIYGEDDFQQAMSALTNTITAWCSMENHWIPLNDIPLSMTYDGSAVYDRGAVVVNTMMNYLGRETFLNAIRYYLETHAYGAASSSDLRIALGTAANIDMDGFFETYVTTPGMPHYEVGIVNVTPIGNQYETTFKMSYAHIGASHVGQNNRVDVTWIGADGRRQTDRVCWDGLEDQQVITLDFEPVAAFVDFDNRILDAKITKNVTATGSTTVPGTNMSAAVSNVTDSTLVHLEGHLVGPDNDPEIPGLAVSTSHYWNILRQDYGSAQVTATFIYSYDVSMDGDIIHTENDSAVLLYRSNFMEPWHTIPYTRTGTWKVGQFTINDLQTGQYTIGAIDKSTLAVSEAAESPLELFPNPASDQVTVRWEQASSGAIRIYNQNLQLVRSIPFDNANQVNIPVGDLAKGLYFVDCNASVKTLILR